MIDFDYTAYAAEYNRNKQAKLEQDLRSDRRKLTYWLTKLGVCESIEALTEALKEFYALSCWTLAERSRVSSCYTPLAVKLLNAREDKHRVLEDLAVYCWNKGEV